jgi:hypothetical protein
MDTWALHGMKITLRVEMLVSAANLPAAAEKPSLADRITYVDTFELSDDAYYTGSLQQHGHALSWKPWWSRPWGPW